MQALLRCNVRQAGRPMAVAECVLVLGLRVSPSLDPQSYLLGCKWQTLSGLGLKVESSEKQAPWIRNSHL